jgi:DNA modification methylase
MAVRLHWEGREVEVKAPPLSGVRGWENSGKAGTTLMLGDALDCAGALLANGLEGKVDLVYLDPPFASQADYTLEARLDGAADGRIDRRAAYGDRWNKEQGGVAAYLDMLYPRLHALYRLLREDGTLWVHLDWRANYLVRVLLDEIAGRDAFLNEIVWKRAPNLGRQAASAQFGRTLDTLIVYGKPKATLRPPTRLERIEPSAVRVDDEGRPFTTAPRGDYTDISIAKLEKEGRVHRSPGGKVYIKYFLEVLPDGGHARARRVDALWNDIAPLRHVGAQEKTGYPTQKPRALLERVIASGTDPGGLVVDLFSGSGTTGEAAHLMGRSVILGDASPVAIATARARLLRAGAEPTLQTCNKNFAIDAKIEVKSKKKVDGSYDVELLSPTEPLAWCIDAEEAGAVFTRSWHSERQPGRTTVPCAMHANVPRKPRSVRAYDDGGTVHSSTPMLDGQLTLGFGGAP